MIRLEMEATGGHISVRFDVPDKPGEKLRIDELGTFALHLDVIKNRIIELTDKAIAKQEGYDLVIAE